MTGGEHVRFWSVGTASKCVLWSAAVLTLFMGCGLEPPVEPPRKAPPGPITVYRDGLAEGVEFQASLGTSEIEVQEDVVELPGEIHPKQVLRVDIAGHRLTQIVGGVFRSERPYDLSGTDALEIRIRASDPIEANLGFGDAGLGVNVALWITAEWATIHIPLPVPELLVDQETLFSFFFEMSREEGRTLWIESIAFVSSDEATPSLRPVGDVVEEYDRFEGQSIDLPGQRFEYEADGTLLELHCEPGYLDFVVWDEDVALVSGEQLRVTGDGATRVTAMLGGIEARVTLEVRGYAPPEDPPADPELSASQVFSLFSDEYETFGPVQFSGGTSVDGDIGVVSHVDVDGNTVKLFSVVDKPWFGEPMARFADTPVDAAQYGSVRFDMWVPGVASPSNSNDPELRLGIGEAPDRSPTVIVAGGDSLQYNTWMTYEVLIADFTTVPPAIGGTLNGEEALHVVVFRNLGIAVFAIDNLMFVR